MRVNRILKIFIISLLLVNVKVFSIEITPTSFVYKLDALGISQDVNFYNRKDLPERVKISFKAYKEDTENKSLAKWGTIFPRIITVPPKGERKVKFALEPPKNLPKGEYRGLLLMEELEQKALENVEGKVSLKNGSITQINMLVNLGIVVYGYIGDPETLKVSGKVEKLKHTNKKISFVLENDGEITKPYELIFEGIDKETREIKKQNKRITVVQGYKENLEEEYPKDLIVKKIYLKDSKERKLFDIKL